MVALLAYMCWRIDFAEPVGKDRFTSFLERKPTEMTTLVVILIAWVALSVPAALVLARLFRSNAGNHDRDELGAARDNNPEFDRTAEELTPGTAAGKDDTNRVFPPR
ncbi:hypothetical protein [Nocardia huaxiensis]|uniref:Uncharacterized protein n=1 Tax=Nocardia huaxiensis TaxID=2755382 RepID=A0A7D6VHD4_9NOCA|nr:hypothetical protein [Nocardia huaxiensis]QLY30096.1 hypothetical protein H0264_33775 [Nocardia huaxiensis]UFS96298.1 hypothetical protein LPY97_37675 [Nocardia huaxiensis]